VDFPIKNGGSFHSYVKLPEGISVKCGFFTHKQHHLSHLVTPVTDGHHVLSFRPPLARYDAVAFRDAESEMGAVQSCEKIIDRAKKTLDFPEMVGVFGKLTYLEHILIQHHLWE